MLYADLTGACYTERLYVLHWRVWTGRLRCVLLLSTLAAATSLRLLLKGKKLKSDVFGFTFGHQRQCMPVGK
jgi:hypothetical protein